MMYDDKNFQIVKTLYPEATQISLPKTPGIHTAVYIAQGAKGKYVFRFVPKHTAFHNAFFSKLLRKYSIPAPEITLHNISNQYIEQYPHISGATLQERIRQGISKDKLLQAYSDVFQIIIDMSKIPLTECIPPYNKMSLKHRIKSKYINILCSKHYTECICHKDLNFNNVLVDDNDKICAVLDLDSIKISNPLMASLCLLGDARKYNLYPKEVLKIININPIIDIETQMVIWDKFSRLYHRFHDKEK